MRATLASGRFVAVRFTAHKKTKPEETRMPESLCICFRKED
ncbi:MAG: hypothetical protein ABIL18_07505 [candidate division WOR-3 bacterium]